MFANFTIELIGNETRLLLIFVDLIIVLLVKRNTRISYSYFHRMFMFLLFMSVTFYRCIEKRHSKSFHVHVGKHW